MAEWLQALGVKGVLVQMAKNRLSPPGFGAVFDPWLSAKGKEASGKPEKSAKPAKGEKGEAAGKTAAPGPAKPAEEKAAKQEPMPESDPPRLKVYFEDVVRKKLSEEFGYKNRLQVPVIEKIVINMGIGEGVNDRKKV